MSRNLMAFNLGFSTGFPQGSPDLSHDSQAIDDLLKEIEQDFLLVLIMEYIDESLVLLKRFMCWRLSDILYQKRNSGKYTKTETINVENYNIYKNWSNVDFRLYDHFSKVFWKKVYAQGPDFMVEVAHFKQTNSQVMGFCDNRMNSTQTIFTVEESKWNEKFIITFADCELFQKQLTKEIKEKYDGKFSNLMQVKPKLPTC